MCSQQWRAELLVCYRVPMQTEVRHIRLDKATLKRVKAIAARREWSEAKVLRKAVEEYVKRER